VARDALDRKPLEAWQVKAAESPHAGNVTRPSEYDPTAVVDGDDPFHAAIDDTPGSGLDGADIVDDVDPVVGATPKPKMHSDPFGGGDIPVAGFDTQASMGIERMPPPASRAQQALNRVRQAAGSNFVRVPAAAAAAFVGYKHASNALWPPAPPVGVPDFGDDPGEPMPVSAPIPGDEAALLQSIREMRLREMLRPKGGPIKVGYSGNVYQD
jgi:hypothetical protein